MAFIESRLSDRVAMGFQSTASYDVRIVTLDNGREKRNINQTKAKRRFAAVFVTWTKPMFDELLAAFHACSGAGYSFRFKDWMDYQAEFEPLGNTPGANSNAVQLKKTYTFGAQSISRTITKPVAGTVYVYQDNGSGSFLAKTGSIDTTTGLFTPTTAWTAGRALKASFEFDVAVRFESSSLPSSWDNKRIINAQCNLVEDFL